MAMQLYLDMDGVLADFDGALAARGIANLAQDFIHLPKAQWTPEQVDLDRRVREVMDDDTFWRGIPAMADAGDLVGWAMYRAPTFRVLTARPKHTDRAGIIAGIKVWWLHQHFSVPASRVIVCLRSEKKRHASNESVLVDDTAPNCAEWQDAGGKAVHHQSAADTIRKLESIYG